MPIMFGRHPYTRSWVILFTVRQTDRHQRSQYNTESSTRWLCWPSRVAAATQHRHTSVVTSRLASVNGYFARLPSHYTGQAVRQDRLRETSLSLFCANCLELVPWDNNYIGDYTKAAARQTLNCIKNKKMAKNDFQYGGWNSYTM